MAADMASAIPVFPLVASMRVSPGLIAPALSASDIMLIAGLQARSQGSFTRERVPKQLQKGLESLRASCLSFTEPAGLLPSNLQSTTLEGFGLSRCRRTSGVWPTKSSTVG